MITRKGIKTKELIVSTASLFFQQEDINKVTIADITSSASIGKGTFYSYFDSKDDLIWCIMDKEIKSFFSLFEGFMAMGYETEDINHVADKVVDYVISKKATLKMVSDIKFYGYIGKERILKTYYQEFGLVAPIKHWLERGKNLGKIEILDINFSSYFITNVIDEVVNEVIYQDLPYTINDLRQNLKYMLNKILEVPCDCKMFINP